MNIKPGMLVATPRSTNSYLLGMIIDHTVINNLDFFTIDWYYPAEDSFRMDSYAPSDVKQYLRDYKIFRGKLNGELKKL